ncbi:MAG: hypothetical protein FMNOHCHN_03976 [Ignavibacteriaceae bacterium]|nr:hypothetical protein [Ignavibacteriaceae bacterium]
MISLRYLFTLLSVVMLLQACDREPVDSLDALTRYEWLADTVYTVDYSKAAAPPSLRMDRTNDKFHATGGCNDITGDYRITGNKIFFNNFSQPVDFCEGSFETEQKLVHMLKSAFFWEIREEKLYLYYKSTLIGVFRKKD